MSESKKNKSLSRVVAWNITAKFFLQGLSFISAPIFVNLLTKEDYGEVAIYSTWVGIFSLFIGLQTYGSIANAKIKYPEDEIDSYLSSIMTLSLLMFMIVLFVCIIANGPISSLLSLRGDLLIVLVFQSFFAFVVNFYSTKWMQFKEVEKNTIVSILLSVAIIILSVLLVLYSGLERYVGRIYGFAIPKIILGIIFIFFIYKKGKVIFNKTYSKFCLTLTLPLILHGAGGLILSQSDRIMIEKFVGTGSVGVYSFAYSLAIVISAIWGAFNTSWVPFYYEYKKNNDYKSIYTKSKNYMLVFSIITVGFILLAPEVYKLMSPEEYWAGIYFIPLIALAYYFNFLYAFPGNHEFFHEQTIFISIGTLMAAGVNIMCNLFFVPRYAGLGAAISSVIAYVFLLLFHDLIARFLVRNFEYSPLFYFKGAIPVIGISVLYYFTLDMWLLRWSIGFILGVYLLQRIIRKRALF